MKRLVNSKRVSQDKYRIDRFKRDTFPVFTKIVSTFNSIRDKWFGGFINKVNNDDLLNNHKAYFKFYSNHSDITEYFKNVVYEYNIEFDDIEPNYAQELKTYQYKKLDNKNAYGISIKFEDTRSLIVWEVDEDVSDVEVNTKHGHNYFPFIYCQNGVYKFDNSREDQFGVSLDGDREIVYSSNEWDNKILTSLNISDYYIAPYHEYMSVVENKNVSWSHESMVSSDDTKDKYMANNVISPYKYKEYQFRLKRFSQNNIKIINGISYNNVYYKFEDSLGNGYNPSVSFINILDQNNDKINFGFSEVYKFPAMFNSINKQNQFIMLNTYFEDFENIPKWRVKINNGINDVQNQMNFVYHISPYEIGTQSGNFGDDDEYRDYTIQYPIKVFPDSDEHEVRGIDTYADMLRTPLNIVTTEPYIQLEPLGNGLSPLLNFYNYDNGVSSPEDTISGNNVNVDNFLAITAPSWYIKQIDNSITSKEYNKDIVDVIEIESDDLSIIFDSVNFDNDYEITANRLKRMDYRVDDCLWDLSKDSYTYHNFYIDGTAGNISQFIDTSKYLDPEKIYIAGLSISSEVVNGSLKYKKRLYLSLHGREGDGDVEECEIDISSENIIRLSKDFYRPLYSPEFINGHIKIISKDKNRSRVKNNDGTITSFYNIEIPYAPGAYSFFNNLQSRSINKFTDFIYIIKHHIPLGYYISNYDDGITITKKLIKRNYRYPAGMNIELNPFALWKGGDLSEYQNYFFVDNNDLFIKDGNSMIRKGIIDG